jgi:hypothetical protein
LGPASHNFVDLEYWSPQPAVNGASMIATSASILRRNANGTPRKGVSSPEGLGGPTTT